MSRILKYERIVETGGVLELPRGAQYLNAQMQGEHLVMWFLVEGDETQKERRHFPLVCTGMEIKNAIDMCYLATIQDAEHVWHLFEKRAGPK